MENFISYYSASTHIHSDNPQTKKTQPFYRSCTNKTYTQLLSSHIIGTITLPNTASRSIRRTYTPSLLRLVLLSMCEFVTCCSGIIYITAWLKMHMGNACKCSCFWHHPWHQTAHKLYTIIPCILLWCIWEVIQHQGSTWPLELPYK